jgi:acyl-CoA synthetase (AMP-forming)/AMP-acid ligase II
LLHPSLWSTFEALSGTAPDVAALLELGREPLRFADLPARLASIRDSLADLGISRGDRVASALPRGADTAVCFLGVASCAIHVPLNPAYSEAEFARYLAKLRPVALIVAAHDMGAARRSAVALGIPVIDLVPAAGLASGSFTLCHLDRREPVARAWNTADDVALVLLTSGTTSEQKFVPIRQRHLLAYARASADHYRLDARDRGLHVMPMYHGHGLKSSLLAPLACGSGVIVSHEFSVASFFRQMTELHATWYSAAAAIHHVIAQRIDGYRDAACDARLRFIRSGSARLDPKVAACLEEAFGAPVLERYGMSETCTLAGTRCRRRTVRRGASARRCSTKWRSSTPRKTSSVPTPSARSSRAGPASSTITSTIRRPRRRPSSTAGFAPVTWAGSMPTAT